MKLWVARDRDETGWLTLFNYKPIRGDAIFKDGQWLPGSPALTGIFLDKDHPIGKDLNWEMEPREVILMDVCEHIRLMDKIAKMERKILNG